MEQDAVLIGAASRQNTTDMLHEITGISRKHTPSSVRLETKALVRVPKVRARTYKWQAALCGLLLAWQKHDAESASISWRGNGC